MCARALRLVRGLRGNSRAGARLTRLRGVRSLRGSLPRGERWQLSCVCAIQASISEELAIRDPLKVQVDLRKGTLTSHTQVTVQARLQATT